MNQPVGGERERQQERREGKRRKKEREGERASGGRVSKPASEGEVEGGEKEEGGCCCCCCCDCFSCQSAAACLASGREYRAREKQRGRQRKRLVRAVFYSSRAIVAQGTAETL